MDSPCKGILSPSFRTVGTELAVGGIKTRLRCRSVRSSTGRYIFSAKGYEDERSHKRKIHDGASIAEKLPRNEFGGSGNSGVCGTDCECSREGKHAKSRARPFLERSRSGEQGAPGGKSKLQHPASKFALLDSCRVSYLSTPLQW